MFFLSGADFGPDKYGSPVKEIRDARPDQMMVRKAMMDFIEACKLKNCVVQEGYIQSLGM